MPRKKSKKTTKQAKGKNNRVRKQTRMTEFYLSNTTQQTQPETNTIEDTPPTPERHQPKSKRTVQQDTAEKSDSGGTQPQATPDHDDAKVISEHFESDNDIQYVGTKQAEKQKRTEFTYDDSEEESEEQSDGNGSTVNHEEEQMEKEDNKEETDEDKEEESDTGESEREETEENENKEKETTEPTQKNNNDEAETDDDEEKEWNEEENVATTQDTINAVTKGQVRFQSEKPTTEEIEEDTTTGSKFKQRRLAVMVNIPEVDNNVDRLSHLVSEMNEFLKFARKNKSKFRLRPFDTLEAPEPNKKNQWRTRMIDNDSADFRTYCQGYFPFSTPRGGNYRLRINAVMDEKVSLPTLIENVTHDWGHKDNCAISDIKAQNIYDPVKIGYLMRATQDMLHIATK